MIRPGPMQGIYEYLVPADRFWSGGVRFDLQRCEVWIWVDETVDGKGTVKEINYVCIPVEYVLTVAFILAAPVILSLDYLARRRTDISRQAGAPAALKAGPVSDRLETGQLAVGSLRSVGRRRALDSRVLRLGAILIVIATLAALMVLAAA